MRFLFCILIFIFIHPTHAKLSQNNMDLCQKEIAKKFKKSNIVWSNISAFTANKYGEMVYKIPTKKLGKWALLQKIEDKIEFQLFSNYKIVTTLFTNKDCKLIANKNKNIKSKSGFNDKNLVELIKKYKKGLIYIWSPGNTYSFTQYKKHYQIAKKLKLKWVPLMASGMKHRELSSFRNYIQLPKAAYTRLNSIELKMRGGISHSPTTFIFNQGRINDKLLVGVFEPKAYLKKISNLLNL